MNNRSKIFVAGGTGFLGRRVIQMLENRRYNNYCSVSLSQGVDFRDKKQTENYFKKEKPDIVFHCAAFIGGIKFGLDHAAEVYYNNILISTNLIESARIVGVEKFISPIANCAYPDVVDKEFKEEEFWNGPLNETVMVYGMVRKAQWAQTWAYNHQYGMSFINLILPNMYGPADYFDKDRSHALCALIMKIVEAKENKIPEVIIWGSGRPVREWLYVNDAAEALVRSIKINYSVEPINIGVGKGISIADLALLIKRIVGYKGKLGFDKTRPDGALYKVMNATKCQKVLGWLPNTALEDGIKETIDWYYKNILHR